MSAQYETTAVAVSASAATAAGADRIAPRAGHAAPGHAAPGHTAAGAEARSGLSWVDRLTLVAIGIVVVLVTLPVLRGFGLRENERDALRVLRVLASHPTAPATAPGAARVGAADLSAALADPSLRQRLENLEALEDGRLRRHGYLFDRTVTPDGEPVLRAWPWEHGQTGRGAFLWTPTRGIVGTPNADGRFSGPAAAPEWGDVAQGGWFRVGRR